MKAKLIAESLDFKRGDNPHKALNIGEYADPLKYIETYIRDNFQKYMDYELEFSKSHDWSGSYEMYIDNENEEPLIIFYNPPGSYYVDIEGEEPGWNIEKGMYAHQTNFAINDLEGVKKYLEEYRDKYYS